MKQWKTDLINKVIESTNTDKIISFKDIANQAGYNHINTNDTKDIMRAVLKKVPSYYPVQMINPKNRNESLFTTLHFIDNTVVFE